MIGDIVPLAKKLLEIQSLSGDTEKAVEVLEFAKKPLSEHPFTSFASNGFPSLLYTNQTEEIKKFKIIFNAHLDVVPAPSDQFAPIERDGRLYGRGSYDTKAAAAAMILVFKELAQKLEYPLGLQLTTDEELGGENGTLHQIEQGVRGNFIIASECSSNFSIIHEAKARMVLKLTAKGKHSHSAYPWLGENAIWKLQKTLQKILQSYPWQIKEEYKTTINITHITTGNVEKSETAYNRTPEHCEAILDVRYIPGDEHIIVSQIQSLIEEGVSMQILHNTKPHQTPADNKYITRLQEVGAKILHKPLLLKKQHGTSDIRHYSSFDNYGIEFGPIGANHHTDNEWVDIESLTDYYQILKKFLLSLNE